jgi:hypothetical protein
MPTIIVDPEDRGVMTQVLRHPEWTRTDKDKPNAPVGGFMWMNRGSLDALDDVGDLVQDIPLHYPAGVPSRGTARSASVIAGMSACTSPSNATSLALIPLAWPSLQAQTSVGTREPLYQS